MTAIEGVPTPLLRSTDIRYHTLSSKCSIYRYQLHPALTCIVILAAKTSRRISFVNVNSMVEIYNKHKQSTKFLANFSCFFFFYVSYICLVPYNLPCFIFFLFLISSKAELHKTRLFEIRISSHKVIYFSYSGTNMTRIAV